MGNSNSRGQSAIELMIILLLLTSLILLALEYTSVSAKIFKPVQLSKDAQ